MNTDFTQHIVQLPNVRAEIHQFKATDTSKWHIMLHIDNSTLPFDEQLQSLNRSCEDIISTCPEKIQIVLKRYFISDASNQEAAIEEYERPSSYAVSIIQQPPLDNTKIALWVYATTDAKIKKLDNGFCVVQQNGLLHLWLAQKTAKGQDSEQQTLRIFDEYTHLLQEEGCSLKDNCIRTWFYVNDVDNQYAGMVKARNHVFATENLTEQTHFIASTGIGGRQKDSTVWTQMDAYAIHGIQPEQIHYLYAADHLNRTSEYGVSFERGTYVDYSDHRELFISGTASINNKGEIVHQGNLRKQVLRMWENVEALLLEGQAQWENVAQMVIYLRDIGDYPIVSHMFQEHFPHKPKVIVLAPVCRPGWLIEMECIALKEL